MTGALSYNVMRKGGCKRNKVWRIKNFRSLACNPCGGTHSLGTIRSILGGTCYHLGVGPIIPHPPLGSPRQTLIGGDGRIECESQFGKRGRNSNAETAPCVAKETKLPTHVQSSSPGECNAEKHHWVMQHTYTTQHQICDKHTPQLRHNTQAPSLTKAGPHLSTRLFSNMLHRRQLVTSLCLHNDSNAPRQAERTTSTLPLH